MNASRRVPLSQRFVAGVLTVIVAGLALILAWPGEYPSSSLRPALLFAGTLNAKTTTKSVQLSNAIVLEPGATLYVHPAGKKRTDGASDQTANARKPRLLLKNATLTFRQATAAGKAPDKSLSDAPDGKADAALKVFRSLGFERLDVENARLQLRQPGGGLIHVGHITSQVVTADGAVPGLRATGNLTRHGKTVQFDVVKQPTETDDRKAAVDLKISGPLLKLQLSGNLSSKKGVQISADAAEFKTHNLKAVLAWLGVHPIKSRGLKEFEATGNLTWNGSSVAFDQAQFAIDGNQANGRLSFSFDPRRPAVEGTLAFQDLKLNAYLNDDADQTNTTHPLTRLWTALQKTCANDTLPLGLKHVDADLRLSTKSLQLSGIELGRGAAVVIAKDGVLKSDLADINLAIGAKGRAHVSIDVTGFLPRYVLRGNFQQVDLGGASSHWLGKPIVDGVADMTFDLAAQGQDNKALIKTLSGPIVVSAQNSASIPIDVVQLFNQTKQTPNDGWGNFEGGFTALKNLSVELMSSRGALTTKSVKANIDGNALIATGTLKLSDLVLDLVLTKRAAADKTAKAELTPGEPARPHRKRDTLQLKGPISEPVIRLVAGARRG